MAAVTNFINACGCPACIGSELAAHLREIACFARMNTVWANWLADKGAIAPERATVEATLVISTLRVEMTAISALV
ncbi:MAG: hypothetical protein K2Q97_15335 [Burkholderiaceae bacterium]|nr:hypothetical protein [Burkholderiaceae bacterium]